MRTSIHAVLALLLLLSCHTQATAASQETDIKGKLSCGMGAKNQVVCTIGEVWFLGESAKQVMQLCELEKMCAIVVAVENNIAQRIIDTPKHAQKATNTPKETVIIDTPKAKTQDAVPTPPVQEVVPKKEPVRVTDAASLKNVELYHIDPTGKLHDMFIFGSDYTDLQREAMLKELKGKVVQWRLPVYEVSKAKNGYKIQTSNSDNAVGCFVTVTPLTESETQKIFALKTGDFITIKGMITGKTFLRNFNIEPAIIIE